MWNAVSQTEEEKPKAIAKANANANIPISFCLFAQPIGMWNAVSQTEEEKSRAASFRRAKSLRRADFDGKDIKKKGVCQYLG